MPSDTKSFRHFIYAFIACMLILQIGALFENVPRALTGDGDFIHFYRPAFMIRSGDAHRMYIIDEQVRFEHIILPQRNRPIQIYYHPPFEAFLIVPLSLLSYKTAFWIWSAAGLLALLLGARILAPELPHLRRAAAAPVWLLFLCFFPVANTILQGQDSLFLFCVLAFAYREFRRKREIAAGLLLGCALFKFQYIVPLVFIIGLVRWRPKLLFSCGLVAVALAGFSWWLLGTGGAVSYWHLLQHHNIENNWELPDLRGFLLTLGATPLIVVLVSIALAVWTGLRKIRSPEVEFSAALLVAALISYHAHVYDLSILLIPLAVCLEKILAANNWQRALLPALFFVVPLYGLLLTSHLYFLLAVPILALVYLMPRWTDAPPSPMSSHEPTATPA